jgi:hypothetical protein
LERRKRNIEGDKHMTQYTVRTKKKVKTLNEGHDWSEELPNEMFVKKFNFTGHEYGPIGRGRKTKAKEFELFWDPKTLKSATELLDLLDAHKMTARLDVIQE